MSISPNSSCASSYSGVDQLPQSVCVCVHVGVCLHAHTCSQEGTCVHMHVKPEDPLGCLPQLFSILRQHNFPILPGTLQFSWAGWPGSTKEPPVPTCAHLCPPVPIAPEMGFQAQATTPGLRERWSTGFENGAQLLLLVSKDFTS